MTKSHSSFLKKQKEIQRKKKQDEKIERKKDRQKNSTGGALENMLAYVDEFGNITSTPPEKSNTINF